MSAVRRGLTAGGPPIGSTRSVDTNGLHPSRHLSFLRVPLSLLSSEEVVALIAQRPTDAEFAYIVTPNVDHVVRVHRQSERFSWLYRKAWLSICDSRILSGLAGLLGVAMPVTTGSDVTRILFAHVMQPGDRVTVIGCAEEAVAQLRTLYPGIPIAHYDPPMGFINNEDEVNRVVDFVAANPARFVFLCVGSPRQEVVAYRLRQHGGLTGLGLCVGNALNFLAFPETRAPRWVSRCGLEWLYRLSSDPKRLWRRYLVDDPLIFAIFAKATLTHSAIESSPVMGADAVPRRAD